MIKKCILSAFVTLLFIVTVSSKLSAQFIPNYTFSQSSGFYNPITSYTVLANGLGYDNERYNVSLPFPFKVDNTTYNSVYIAMNGFISFGNNDPGSGYWMISSAVTGFSLISGFDFDLGSLDTSTRLGYTTTGISPNREFIVQWKNVGKPGTNVLSVNFQIRLREFDNTIQVMYGGISLNTGSNISVQLGLRGLNNTIFYNRSSATSQWNATTSGGTNAANIYYAGGSNPSSGQTYLFTPPPNCATPNPPSNLVFTPAYTSISGSFTASSPAANKYMVVRTNGSTSLNTLPTNGTVYSGTIGNGTIVYNGPLTTFNSSGLSQATTYRYTIIPYNDVACLSGPAYNIASLLTDTTTTLGPRVYNWLPTSGSADFQLASNWAPARINTDNYDTLIFGAGGQSSVTNIPTDYASLIHIKNNTSVTMYAANSDSIILLNGLKVDYGTSLILDGTNLFKMVFNTSGAEKYAQIDGTLSLNGNNVFNVKYSVTKVTGSVNVNGTKSMFYTSCGYCPNDSTFFGNASVLNLNRDSCIIPKAYYDANSFINITNVIQKGIFGPLNDLNVGHVTVDCPMAISAYTLPSTVRYVHGNMLIKNTGNATLTLSPHMVDGTFKFLKGGLNFASAPIFNGDVFLDTGKVTSGGFIVKKDIFITAKDTLNIPSTYASIEFRGTTHQYFTQYGYYIAPKCRLVLSNPYDATFTGSINFNTYAENAIMQGSWFGSGTFVYAVQAALGYYCTTNHVATATEWPIVNGPNEVRMDMANTSPNNRLRLPGNRTVGTNLYLDGGVMVLDTNDLIINGIANLAGGMVATNGSGTYYCKMGAGSPAATFPLGDITGNDESSYVNLKMFGNTTTRYMGMNVKDAVHLNATSPYALSRYWHISDTTASPSYTYTLALNANPTDYSSANADMQVWNGSSWNLYPGLKSASNDVYTPAAISVASYPLNNRDFTAFPNVPAVPTNVYTWTGAVSNDYQVAGNWSPNRNTLYFLDQLVFNNGITDSVKNIPSQTIGRLTIKNNTTVVFVPNTSNTMTIQSDNDSVSNDLFIENGSSMFLNGGNFVLRFGGTKNKCLIDGRFEIPYNVAVGSTGSQLDLAFCTCTVSATGVLASGGNADYLHNPFNSNKTSLIIYGTYENKSSTMLGVYPYATWKDGSNTYALNYTTYATTSPSYPLGTNQSFYNFTYNCPGQTGVVNWNTKGIDTVRNELKLISSGSSYWQMPNFYTNKFIQSGGSLHSFGGTFIFKDSVLKTGGTFINAYTLPSTMEFSGQNGRQVIVCNDSSFSGPMNYYIKNPSGISITGTGYFATQPYFSFHKNSTLYIQTPVAYPVLTNINLAYDSLSTLRYNIPGSCTSDSIVFPATFSPPNLWVELDTFSKLTMPISRTISGTLTMKSGNISIGNNDFILGISTTVPGVLSHTSGYIQSTGGYVIRWLGTTVTAAGIGMAFPLSDGQFNRKVYIGFNSTTAISSGGTIKARHQSVLGNVGSLAIADGTYTFHNRTNSSWDIETGNGFALSATGTFNLGCAFDGLGLNNTGTTLRLTHANAVSGTHYNPFLSTAACRQGLTLADINNDPFYIGFEGSNVSNQVYSVQDGNWNNPATWNINAVPDTNMNIVISPGDTVLVNSNQHAYSLTISTAAGLVTSSDSLRIDEFITNAGDFFVNGCTIILGQMGGGKKAFTSTANLRMQSGKLIVNGHLRATGNLFVQTGGEIIVDGNVNGSSTLSDANVYVYIVTDSTLANGGIIKITDPTTDIQDAFYGGGFTFGHALVIGDSTSNTGGGSHGFHINTNGSYTLGNLIISATQGIGGYNRKAYLSGNTVVNGNFMMHSPNSYFSMESHFLTLDGDVLIDSGAYFLANSYLTLTDNAVAQVNPLGMTQHFSGKGTINSGTPNVNFYSVNFNNSSEGGVVFSIGDFSIGNSSYFSKGKVTPLNGAVITEYINPNMATGWVNGKLKLYVPAGNYLSNGVSLNFPVGDSLRSAYVSVGANANINQAVLHEGYISAQVFRPDHPQIGSSAIAPNLSANLFYRVDTSDGLLMTNGNSTLGFNYHTATDLDPGMNMNNFRCEQYSGSIWYSQNTSYWNADTMRIDKNINQISGDYILGEENSMPIIITQPQDQNVCLGDNATFSITTMTSVNYQWEINTGSGWNDVQLSSIYSGVHSSSLQLANVLLSMNNYQYRCKVSNGNGTIYTTVVTLHVGSGVVPTIAITAVNGNIICGADTVTFTTVIANGGNAPVYEWFINGIAQGINTPIFLKSGLNNNDIISCQLTSSSTCATPSSAISNSITMIVNPMLIASVSITANPGNAICLGTSVTYMATPINGGSSPSYQWKKNGSNVGSNSATYTDNLIANGNIITCVMTSNENCISVTSVTSNTITMTVTNPVTPVVTISASPGTTVCAGVSVTFTATPTNGGGSPQYQWLKNGISVGTNSNTYIDNGLLNTDHISCVMMTSLTCINVSSDTSNVLTMIVNPTLTPSATISVSPNDTICAGTSVTFSNVVTNAGTSLSYSWKKNGVSVSTNTNYTTSGLASNDQIMLVINTNPLCASTNVDTSNIISMTVNANVTPLVSITANAGTTICVGDTITFTATPTFGGSSPMYQWKKNGVNVGGNSNTYIDGALISGDIITCSMISNETCLASNNANSNSFTITVNPIVTPTVSISVLPGTTICNGTSVSFTASNTNGGASPTYQWKVNGSNVGTNSNTFTSNTMANGDVVTCELTSSNACANPNVANSNAISMVVNATTTPSVSITANPGTTISAGQLVTFTATAVNAGSSPSYQWKLNAGNVGTNSNTYSSSSLADGDDVSCDVTSNDLCPLPLVANSNVLKISIANAVGNYEDVFSQIFYYPNPTDGDISVKGQIKNAEQKSIGYEIISVTGQTILQGNIEVAHSSFEKTIRFNKTTSDGLYLLKLSVNGKTAYYRLVLIR